MNYKPDAEDIFVATVFWIVILLEAIAFGILASMPFVVFGPVGSLTAIPIGILLFTMVWFLLDDLHQAATA